MILTKFDRWLLERFVYETHIKVTTLPERLPKGIKTQPISDRQYSYLLIVRKNKIADKLIAHLNNQGKLYSTSIAEGSHWYNPLINNNKNSFTYRLFWWIIIVGLIMIGLKYISKFLQSQLYFELKSHIETLLKHT